ncbi:MAG: hypothetical protein H3C34_27915 [Caldilineaceae bacterium]|nr:hypothetical protein [Caldilineaceae bacterium]
MTTRWILERGAMLDLARSLSPVQRQIIVSLRDRGPGLLLEVAVRVLKFPEEVTGPLADLRDKRLVTISEFSGGTFGNELFSLTPLGEQMAALLRDEEFLQQLRQAQESEQAKAAAAVPPPAAQTEAPSTEEEALRREIDLLQKLGDLAREEGDLGKAAAYYEQALEAARKLSSSPNP